MLLGRWVTQVGVCLEFVILVYGLRLVVLDALSGVSKHRWMDCLGLRLRLRVLAIHDLFEILVI